jgi:hypothetical protein
LSRRCRSVRADDDANQLGWHCLDTSAALRVDGIAKSILVLRDQNVLLDCDLADLYGVTTKRLNEQVKRNLARFPMDFMFQLTAEEETALRSHFATSKKCGDVIFSVVN